MRALSACPQPNGIGLAVRDFALVTNVNGVLNTPLLPDGVTPRGCAMPDPGALRCLHSRRLTRLPAEYVLLCSPLLWFGRMYVQSVCIESVYHMIHCHFVDCTSSLLLFHLLR
jgi:hypothetical protein